MLTAQEIAAMSDERRRRLQLGVRSGKHRTVPRPDFSRNQLVAYLRVKGFRSSRALVKGRQAKEPDVYDYRKEFGSWAKAVEFIFGVTSPVIESLQPDDVEYYGRLVVQFDLWTKQDWLAARKRMPEIIPSVHCVRRRFGPYRNLAEYARRLSLASAMNRYMVLTRRLGRCPTMEDCRRDEVDIDIAVRHFGSKKAMDDFIKAGGLIDEKQG